MKIADFPFTVTDWTDLPSSEHPGEFGHTLTRRLHVGDAALRMVEYSPGYQTDHWCDRGHIALVLEGQMRIELRNGVSYILTAGMSFAVSDGIANSHRASSALGAKIFIID